MKTSLGILRLFVYGSLKKGFSNHDRYCSGAIGIKPAHLHGRIFKLTPEFPTIVVPESDILAFGSADTAYDLFLQEETAKREEAKRPRGEEDARETRTTRDRINGEVLSFDDPETRLPAIDGLEEYQPGKDSLYSRVLVRVMFPDGFSTTAWTYAAGFDTGKLERYEGETWFPD